VRIDDPDSSAAISREIDQLFANSRAETKTETERAFQQSFLSAASAVITAINIMSFVIIGIILLVLANTMVMSARERTHEFAVLKALGFSGGQLFFLIAWDCWSRSRRWKDFKRRSLKAGFRFFTSSPRPSSLLVFRLS
jgi:putative ABC transport system permease protein